MRIGNLDAELAAAQLRSLFDVRPIFKRRGRIVARYEDKTKLLFSAGSSAEEEVYKAMRKHSFRKVVSRVVNNAGPLSTCEIAESTGMIEDAARKYVLQASKLGLIQEVREDQYETCKPGLGFGPTFEWYVASCFVREFHCPSFWGVVVEGLPADYDVITCRGSDIGYVECKSGKVSNFKETELHEFLKRVSALAPTFSIFLADLAKRRDLDELVAGLLKKQTEYKFVIPGMLGTGIDLAREDYKKFVRLVPLNAFFVTGEAPLVSTFRQILQFLTLVCDRPMPFENEAAKKSFKAEGPSLR